MISPIQLHAFLLNNSVVQSRVEEINRRNATTRALEREALFSDALVKDYIPQFDMAIRQNSAQMAAFFELFFMLENHIRSIVVSVLEEEHGRDWWAKCVREQIRTAAQLNLQRETDAGVSRRSEEMIDYTNFGELGEIVRDNWDVFGQIFNSVKSFGKVMNSLNTLRATIAHCGVLSEDEQLRMKLTLRDWFRLMQ